MLVFSLHVGGNSVPKFIRCTVAHNKTKMLPLRGIIYSGDNHFTSHIVSPNKDVWFHNGMITKRMCVKEGHLNDFTEKDLKDREGRDAVLLVYAKK